MSDEQMSQQSALHSRVVAFLKTKTPVDLDNLSADAGLLQSSALDSLQLVELIIWIESLTGKPVVVEALLAGEDVTLTGILRYLSNSELLAESGQ